MTARSPRPATGAAWVPRDLRPVGTVGVVVCTHDRRRLAMMSAAVRSVQAQTRPPDELLVMVDGTEDLAAEVRRAVPGVEVAAMGSNQGVSRARNEAAARMVSDWVVFLDDDAEAAPDWLELLVVPLADPDVLGASGRSLPIWDRPRPGWLPEEFLWAFGCSYGGMPEVTTRVRNFFGGSAVVQRRLFLDLGGFSGDLGHRGEKVGGGEEATFCLRATEAVGGTFVYEPASVAHHHVPPSRLTLRYLARRCVGEGVMKARLSAMRPGSGALGEERAFALRLPAAALRSLRRRETRGHAVGMVLGAASVLVGMAWGRLRLLVGGVGRR